MRSKGDEHRAGVLRDLLHCVEPKPALAAADCAPATVAGCVEFFHREGSGRAPLFSMGATVVGTRAGDVAQWQGERRGADGHQPDGAVPA